MGGKRRDCEEEEEVSEDWTQKRDWGSISGRKSSDWEKCLPREEEDMLSALVGIMERHPSLPPCRDLIKKYQQRQTGIHLGLTLALE